LNLLVDYLNMTLLVLASGVCSGLTIGYLSLDKSDLKRKAKLGNKDAQKVLNLRNDSNFLLSALLLGNVGVNAALALYTGKLFGGVMAGVISTAVIFVFGEIVPQAVATRHALRIGAFFYPLIKLLLFIMYPICKPISLVLNKVLGEEMMTIFSKKELEEIIKDHKDDEGSKIDSDEEKVIRGALTYSDKEAKNIMTPKNVMFFLDINTTLNKELIEKVKSKGFTRIPIYEEREDNIVAILNTKDLIGLDTLEELTIRDFARQDKLLTFRNNTKLDMLLNALCSKKCHISIIVDQYNTVQGIVTLEDIIEEILNREIVDETDTVKDLQQEALLKASEEKNIEKE